MAAAAPPALWWYGSLGTVMLGFLAEGLFAPLLAAYLITLVIGLVLAVLHSRRGREPGDPRLGKNSR
jgi:hypothetical protein